MDNDEQPREVEGPYKYLMATVNEEGIVGQN